jgi:hypothetical protein
MSERLLLLASVTPALILGGLLGWLLFQKAVIGSLVVGATLVHEIVLVIFPVCYSALTGFRPEQEMIASVGTGELLRVMSGEALFVLVFACTLVGGCAAGRGGWKRKALGANHERTERRVRVTLYVLVSLGWVLYAFGSVSAVSTLSGDAAVSVGDVVLSIVLAFFWFSSLTACAFVLTKQCGPRKLRTRVLTLVFSGVPLAAVFIVGLSTGIRGRMTWVVSLLILAGLLNARRNIVWFSFGVGVLLLPVFSFLGGAYRFIDKKQWMAESGVGETIARLYSEARRGVRQESTGLVENVLDALAVRAQGPRNSVTLYQDYDNGGGPGFGVYLGAFLFPVPRIIWPAKPVAGGSDMTSLSSAIYRSMKLSYGDRGTMGPILASAHAYWEGGWAWVVVAGAISGAIWSILLALERRLPREIAAMLCFVGSAALLIDGLMTMLVPLYAIVIAAWQSMLPVAFLYMASQYAVCHSRRVGNRTIVRRQKGNADRGPESSY